MAFDFVSAYASSETPFYVAGQNPPTLTEAPQQITLRFSPGVKIDANTLGSISVVRSGAAGDLFGGSGSVADVTITPGNIGVDDVPNQNQVVIRFADPLPDDSYQIRIGSGLKSVAPPGGAADSIRAATTIDLRLDLGAFVVSVVPQPITRSGGVLTQSRDTIAVYFNAEDPLQAASAQTVTSYRLFEVDPVGGAETLVAANNGNPTSVAYEPAAGKATLTFAPGTIADDRLYRLQVGGASAILPPTAPVAEGDDRNSSFASAQDLGTLTSAGATIAGAISVQATLPTPAGNLGFQPPFGSVDAPGHRDIAVEGTQHGNSSTSPGPAAAVEERKYNFKSVYGKSPQNNDLFNVITEAQKQRAREILELFSRYTGIRFVETPDSGFTIATGDTRAVAPNVPPDPLGGIAVPGVIAIMNSSRDWGQSEFGGGWFRVAMHEIGHVLGLQHSYDLPTIMGRGLSGEGVFPGDYDIEELLQYYPVSGSDVDLYKFTVGSAGKLSAETIVARPGQAATSLLDSVLSLYRQNPATGQRELIARNDDSFGRDSFIGLDVQAGTYFLAVSSAGNTSFDPEVADSGFGGRSDGAYSVKLGFEPASTAATTIVDATGTPLDGDRDGKAGGAFSFWFKTASVANTTYVDKTAAAGGDGSLARPYNTISGALANIGSKSIMRIVGNEARKPYLIGTTPQGAPLADGATFNVPADVTVMIDQEAVFKLRGAIIDVGSSTELVSRAGAAIQVLGVPGRRVIFTSYHDDSIGGDSDGVGPVVQGGQWGGIVLRRDSDVASKSAFVNSISQARIRYGGGQVTVDGDLDSYAPIQLESARPTLAFNSISFSAGAAISADPNSFEEGNGRIGPEIRGNRLSDNSINGLFVKIRTPKGGVVAKLDVPARFKSTDIVYVLQENLAIAGGVGGYVEVGGVEQARKSGRLTIDPGVVVKLQGSRIELERGTSQLIAEGTPGRPVIFTALADNRFGAGGTFDTNGIAPDGATAGSWGGIMVNAGAKASIDQAYLGYGGGQTPIEGGFDRFNVIEVHQGDLRLAQSRVENNASGLATGARNGRGTNVAATVFVRGAQPVIIGNDFRNNAGATVSINANSLTDALVADPGRATGASDRDARYDDNRGPLVRDNRLSYGVGSGAIAGMQVRGEEITVESVWDDTDMVHVLQDEIVVHNFHTATGIRLMSQPDASLIVKLAGPNAGFTAAGYALDIDDRIGGTVQVVGQPGYPVILTSLKDDSVGASLDPLGQIMKDTNTDGGGSAPAAGDWRSLKFLPLSNDRNVAIVQEAEKAASGWVEVNATTTAAQLLGILAPNYATDGGSNAAAAEKGGDDNRRLGFEVHGNIAAGTPTDIDVYAFNAYAGSEVWIDIDKTSPALDTMVELLDSSGVVLARSADSQTDASLSAPTRGAGNSLRKDSWRGGDFYSVNPKDAGMRVVLPGVRNPDIAPLYYIRVRSQPRYQPSNTDAGNGGLTATTQTAYEATLRADPATDPAGRGATSGAYELRVRLRQRDEKPGSTVRYADIRFPTIGIDVQGLPRQSLLTGETGETAAANETFATAQDVGNLLQSDRGTISVAGAITAALEVDWYTFTLNYEQIQSIGGVNSGTKTWASVFDIDYADGFKGDLTLSVFDSQGNLLYVGRDSNVASDQPAAGQGSDVNDLSRGSLGKLDPFIGSVQMPAGNPTGSGDVETDGPPVPPDPKKQLRYYVAVSSNERLPAALDATFKIEATNPLIRLEPVNSVTRVVEDHIGFTGYASAGTLISPTTGAIVDVSSTVALATQTPPLTLADVRLFVWTNATGNEPAQLRTVNALTGTSTGTVATGLDGLSIGDLDIRPDGRLYAYGGIPDDTANVGRVVEVNPSSGAILARSNDAIASKDATNPVTWQTSSNDVLAFAFQLTPTTVGDYDQFWLVVREGGGSKLYRAADGGTAAGGVDATANQPSPTAGSGNVDGYRGHIQIGGSDVLVTGLQFQQDTSGMFGVTSDGRFIGISPPPAPVKATQDNLRNDFDATVRANFSGTVGGFSGLAAAPQNLEGGRFRGMFFAITTSGRLVCINPATNSLVANVFDTDDDGIGDSTISNVVGSGTGLAFSPVDINLWHPTQTRGGDKGHGVNDTPDFSRFTDPEADPDAPSAVPETQVNGKTVGKSQTVGGVSMLYGLETFGKQYYDFAKDADLSGRAVGQYGALFNDVYNWQQQLTANPNYGLLLAGLEREFTTGSFSLADYDYTDKPTLYFNYFADSGSALVEISTGDVDENGEVVWEALAGTGMQPQAISASARISLESKNQQVQPLFNSAGWRQARVDLGEYAGQANLRLRFTATTSGEAGKEGFYFDDIIIGFAERGEMVTGAVAAQTDFFTIDTPTKAPYLQQVLTGTYQLEIRRGTEYGATLDPTKKFIGLSQTFDTNADLVPSNAHRLRLGDANQPREQGQFLIQNNIISAAATYGISIDAGTRDTITKAPVPGVARNFQTLNAGRLVPGVAVVNNVIAKSGLAGLLFSGDPNSGAVPAAAVPLGRIVNNTIYGGATPAGVGVDVTQNAAPTLINNLFANLATGVRVDASSSPLTVVATSAYFGITTQVSPGVVQSSEVVLAKDPFVSAATGNFYLAAGTEAIDSALNSLAERNAVTVVASPLGIPPSPLIAPDRDLYGQLRSDDPLQGSSNGQGSNTFKDRGAIDRVDFVQPSLRLVEPLDGSTTQPVDKDPAANVVRLRGTAAVSQTQFVLQLDDIGAGIDLTTVTRDAFRLTRDSVPLAGTDYVFRFLETNKRVVFESPSVFGLGTYVISATLDADGKSTIADLAGNRLLPNKVDGSTSFSIALDNTPGAPTGLVATSDDRQIRIDWIAPDEEPGTVVDYIVEYGTDGQNWLPFDDGVSPVTSATVTNLVNGTGYFFRVAAKSLSATGAFTATQSPVKPVGLPLAPRFPAASGDDASADLSWTAPDANGGTLSDYVVEYSSDAGLNWIPFIDAVSVATAVRVTGLSNGSEYLFRVAAVNERGQGAWVTTQSTVTPGVRASAPVLATPTADDGQVRLTWTAPVDPGTQPITGYRIEYRENGSGNWTAVNVGNFTEGTVRGLVNGTAYIFRIAALTKVGVGQFSAESQPITPARRLTAPTSVSAVRGEGSVAVQWRAPSLNGGGPITDYVVQISTDGGTTFTDVEDPISTATTLEIPGLANDTPYLFRVAAVNAAGIGAFSAPVAPVGRAAAPLLNVTAGDGRATLVWTTPQNGGREITGYRIEFRVSGSLTWTPIGVGVANGRILTGLVNGTTYSFRVAAVTGFGTGLFSTAADGVMPMGPASAPGNLATTVGDGSVALSWDVPISNGGSVISGYLIQYRAATASSWTDGPTTSAAVRTAVVAGLSNDTSYYLRVAAVTGNGPGAFGVTPLVRPQLPAAAPGGLVATSQSAAVALAWRAPAVQSGRTIVDYRIQYSANGGTTWVDFSRTASTLTSARVGGLVNGQAYLFRVAAVTNVGQGAFSAGVAAIPFSRTALPATPTGVRGTGGGGKVDLTWNPVSGNAGGPIVNYVVQYRLATLGSAWVTVSRPASADPSAAVTGLLAGRSYVFRVAARNLAGTGAFSTPSAAVNA